MSIVTVGIDLAKNIFAMHRADQHSNPAQVRPSVKRAALLNFANLPPCHELMDHPIVKTTKIYTHGLKVEAGSMGSPLYSLTGLAVCMSDSAV